MKIMRIALLFIFLLPTQLFGAGIAQTMHFRDFLYRFFNDPEYQEKHVMFPYTFVYYSGEEEDSKLLVEKRGKKAYQFIIGPDHYRCKQNCFDLVIYDNLKRNHKESGERVLALEGVENGINEVLYFKLIDSEWYLVKHESLSN